MRYGKFHEAERRLHQHPGGFQTLRPGQGGRRHQHRHPWRRVLLAARRVGLRKNHTAAHDRGLRKSDPWRDIHRGRTDVAGAALSAAHQHGVPELRHIPPPHGLEEPRLRPALRQDRQGRGGRARRRSPRDGQARGFRRAPVARAFRRPAPAGRARPGPHQAAQGAAPGRTPRRPGQEAPGGHAARAARVAGECRHHLHLRHPRPGRGDDPLGSDRGDVGRQGAPDCLPQGALQSAGQRGGRGLYRADELPRRLGEQGERRKGRAGHRRPRPDQRTRRRGELLRRRRRHRGRHPAREAGTVRGWQGRPRGSAGSDAGGHLPRRPQPLLRRPARPGGAPGRCRVGYRPHGCRTDGTWLPGPGFLDGRRAGAAAARRCPRLRFPGRSHIGRKAKTR